MNAPDGTSPLEWAERLLGIGQPRPRSRFWMGYAALFAALSCGTLLWYALSGDWGEGGSISVVASFFLALWAVSDAFGSSLYARRGAG